MIFGPQGTTRPQGHELGLSGVAVSDLPAIITIEPLDSGLKSLASLTLAGRLGIGLL
jgi:hypothetical protein